MKISITLPNYNHGHYIRDNLDGLLAQTYENWELHVVDDGSTDDSAKIIADYAARDARIKPIYFPQNQGVEAALECGMKAADGELLYCTAADDYICNPHFFEMAVDAFRNTPAAVFSGNVMVHNILLHEKSLRKQSVPEGFLSPKESIRAFLEHRLPIRGQAAILKRKEILRLGKYKEISPYIDCFMITALSIQFGSVFQAETVVVNRDDINNHNRILDRERLRSLAYFERKIKEIELDYWYDSCLWRKWRDYEIKYSLDNIKSQEGFVLNKIQEFIKSIPQKNRDDFGSHIRRVFDIFDDLDEIVQADMNELDNKAAKIFNEIAGEIE